MTTLMGACLFIMAQKTYSEKLKDPRWQKKRLKILERDNFSCVKCFDSDTELQVHHLKYTGEPHEAPNEDLETVCKDCHNVISILKIDIIKAFKNSNKTQLFVKSLPSKHDFYIIDISKNIPSIIINIKENSINNILNYLFSPYSIINSNHSDAAITIKEQFLSYRTERLVIVRFLLKKYANKIIDLSDHKGDLSINWNCNPSKSEMRFAFKAWESLNELNVIHFVNGNKFNV